MSNDHVSDGVAHPPALLVWSELPGVGHGRLAVILARAAERGLDAQGALELPGEVLRRDFSLPEPAAQALAGALKEQHRERCLKLWERLRAWGVVLAGPADAAYPQRWIERVRPVPAFVYAYGNSGLLDLPTLAVLCSRTLDRAAVAATVAVARNAAAEGFTVVGSGMKSAYRIVAAAARAAGGARALVLDRGILTAFRGSLRGDPFGLGPGRAQLDPQRTLVLSPFRPLDHALPGNGRRRDRLVAALADVVVAAHARPGGEMERTCLAALDGGRCVLSWQAENPGLVAAGAVPIGELELRSGLRRFLWEAATESARDAP